MLDNTQLTEIRELIQKGEMTAAEEQLFGLCAKYFPTGTTKEQVFSGVLNTFKSLYDDYMQQGQKLQKLDNQPEQKLQKSMQTQQAEQRIEEVAKGVMVANPLMSREQAISTALDLYPHLYKQYKDTLA